MHQSLFTTSHIELSQIYPVHWLRYNVNEVNESRQSIRIRRKCRSFDWEVSDASDWQSLEGLYARYRSHITFDGAASIQECLFGDGSVQHSIFDTRCIRVVNKGEVVAASFFDLGDRSAASILNFFHPDYRKYSLGKYMMLLNVDFLKLQGLNWYYPGYVVEGLSKMDYKLFLGPREARFFHPGTGQWKQDTGRRGSVCLRSRI